MQTMIVKILSIYSVNLVIIDFYLLIRTNEDISGDIENFTVYQV